MNPRPYGALARQLTPVGDRRQHMQAVVDTLWHGLKDTGVSWVGFYLHEGRDELVGGPRQPKPACSPIGLHGVCGQAFTRREPRIVRDVRELGAAYIPCDPRDRSEIVVPLVEQDGTCRGVLDLDSHDLDSFTPGDEAGLQLVLRAAGLTA
jgi:putative methionine-R-sulfoxide reductase with GAF domain